MSQEEKDARKEARKQARREAERLAQIEADKNQKPVKSISIAVEWKKHRLYSFNPHATADVIFIDGTRKRLEGFSSTGCGYDKESDVLSKVFNALLLYKLHEDRSYDKKPYGISDFKGRRWYEGGVGVDCYFEIAKFIGGKFERVASGRTFDAYTYSE
jgi:hypothetical protein